MKNSHRLISIFVALIIPFTVLADEWVWTDQPTPGAQNEAPSSGAGNEPSYTDGTLSDAILLSEVMPNPEGTDTDAEWIELYNAGTINVDMGNWSLDDEESGSEPYIFPAGTVIEAQDFLVIGRTISKLSLNNDTDQVRLFDFQNTLKDTVTYEGSPEGQSYARIGLEEWAGANNNGVASTKFQAKFAMNMLPQKHSLFAFEFIPVAEAGAWFESPWEWTEEVTVGKENPIYYFIEGTVKELVPFEDSIKIKGEKGELKLSLAKLAINPEIKTTMFGIGQKIAGYATKNPGKTWELRKIDTEKLQNISYENAGGNHRKTIVLILGAAITAGGYFWLQKNSRCLNKKLKI